MLRTTHIEQASLPFSLVSGSGFGISHSSLAQTNSFLPARSMGQADVHCYVNMTTGNLFVQDHVLRFPDIGGSVALFYSYNSQAKPGAAWNLAFGRKLTKIEAKKSITVVEADGREIVYLYNSASATYQATEYEDGMPVIRFDQLQTSWVWYHPNSRVTENFHSDGKLKKHIDKSGNETRYEYTSENKLAAIAAPIDLRYEIKYANEKVEIWCQSELMHTYTFKDGNLHTSRTRDGYEVVYTYNAITKMIETIVQTDKTELKFGFHTDGTNKLKSMQIGSDANNVSTFSYEQQKTILKDAADAEFVLTVDALQKLTQFQSPNADAKRYHYNSSGQLKKIIYPDNSEECFEYAAETGLVTLHKHRHGAITRYTYSDNSLHPLLLAVTEFATENFQSQLSRTCYVYDKIGEYAHLRYEISALGWVKEYMRQPITGMIEAERMFLEDRYLVADNSIPSIEQMNDWVDKLRKDKRLAQTTLTNYGYDKQGNVNRIIRYAKVDAEGVGVEAGMVTEQKITYDKMGNPTERKCKYAPDKYFCTSYAYDDLNRETRATMGDGSLLKQETLTNYAEDKTTRLLPNSRVEKKIVNPEGQLAAEIAAVTLSGEVKERQESISRDSKHRVAVITLPDKNQLIQFFDEKQQLNAAISPSGHVTTIEYSEKYRYRIKRQYANPVDITSLLMKSGSGVCAEFDPVSLKNQIEKNKDPEHDRIAYVFNGLQEKPRYEVDPEGYLTEYRYDTQGMLTNKISYKNPVTAEELDALINGNELQRQWDRNVDSVHSDFYDSDGNKIGEQDPAGYVTEFVLDAAGRIIEEIHYDTPNLTSSNAFAEIRPAKSAAKDAHHYYFYNALNLCELEVDAEGYIKTHEYDADTKKKQSISYAKKVDLTWYANTKIAPVPSLSTTGNDHLTYYAYDSLRRLIGVHESTGKSTAYSYDEMNNIIAQHTYDDRKPTSAHADHRRGVIDLYDAWGQVVTHANPFVSQKISEIKLDTSCPDDEKKIKISKLLAIASERYEYDDVSGLKVKSTDVNGHATIYFYDKDRQPVVFIDATGAVIQHTLNGFGEVKVECKYYQRLAKEVLSSLNGGYLTAAIEKLFEHHEKDVITTYAYDRRGQIIKTIDPEQNVSTFKYDAYKRCERQWLPLQDKIASLEIEYKYDQRGLVTMTTKTANNKKIITLQKYNHYLGGLTDIHDEVGGYKKIERDKLGRACSTSILTEDGSLLVEDDRVLDAFGRPLLSKTAAQQTTSFNYNDTLRQTTISQPIASISTQVKQNIFGEIIEKTDGLGNVEKIEHAPNGDVALRQLGDEVTSVTHDLVGNIKTVTDPEQAITTYEHNPANQIVEKLEDAAKGGLNLKTTYVPNAFGQNEVVIDPNGVTTKNDFDRCGNRLTAEVDPGTDAQPGLRLLTTNVVNAQGHVTKMNQGVRLSPDQYKVKSIVDDFNRVKANVIDPAGLNITTAYERDDAGQIIKETDANGNVKRAFYNVLQQKRFEVTAHGDPEAIVKQVAVKEWTYTPTGKARSVREYALPVAAALFNDSTSLADVKAQLSRDSNDKATLLFYDKNDREKYKLNVLYDDVSKTYKAIVEEKCFDAANNEVKTTHYAGLIDAASHEQWTTESVDELVKAILNPNKDHVIYHYYSVAGREVFTIDNDGAIIEKQYDKCGRCIAEIAYGRAHPEPDLLFGLSTEKVANYIEPFKDNARTRYFVYDHAGREIFSVEANGAVTRRDYDKNGNILVNCRFKDTVNTAIPYAELVKCLTALLPDPSKDAIITTEYDKAGRVTSKTDALNKKDCFELDALGCVRFHTDRNGNVRENIYNAAKQLEQELTPAATISYAKKLSDGKLISADVKTKVSKHTQRDALGNAIKITEAKGIDKVTDGNVSERPFIIRYNAANQPVYTCVPNAMVDAMAAGTPSGNSKQTNIETFITYDTRGNKIAERDEAGVWSYYVYDSIGRLTYAVRKQEAVTKYTYNALGQIEEEYRYATPIKSDPTIYGDIAKRSQVLAQLQAHSMSTDDRVKSIQYNRAGKFKNIQTSKVLFYANGTYGLAQPEEKYEYNLFGDCIYEARLVSPTVWAEKFYWRDRLGNIIYEVNETKHVTYYQYNADGKVQVRTEYDLPLSVPVSTDMLIEVLALAIKKDPLKDRTYVIEYDLRGDVIAEKLLDVTAHVLTRDASGKPVFAETQHEFIGKSYTYSPTQKLTGLTLEDGSAKRLFYDELDMKVAETAVPRTTSNEAGAVIQVTPLTVEKKNAFGQTIATLRSPEATAVIEEGKLPNFSAQTNIYESIQLHDSRGLVAIKQDNSGHQVAYTYTPTKKTATQKLTVTGYEKTKTGNNDSGHFPPPPYREVKYEEMVVFGYDIFDRTQRVSSYRDNKLEELTCTQYNVFGDVTGVGDDSQSPVYRKVDGNGYAWLSNADDGVPTLQLRNLLGHDTLRIQSTYIDLSTSQLNEESIKQLLAGDRRTVELQEIFRDAHGNLLACRQPIWFRDPATYPHPTHEYQYDRWHNIVKKWDSKRNETVYEIDKRGLLRQETKPLVDVVNVDASIAPARPVFKYYHDKRGFQMGVMDANQHCEALVLDEAGQMTAHILADGVTSETRVLDVLGRPVMLYDASKNKTVYRYDAMNNVVWQQSPTGVVQEYRYNEKGSRSLIKDLRGGEFRFNYDTRMNCTERMLHLGQCTRFVYDRNRQQLRVTFATGNELSWERDWFGKPRSHVDLSQRLYHYEYNAKHQLRRQTASGGPSGPARSHGHITPGSVTYSPTGVPTITNEIRSSSAVPRQDLVYDYAFGLLETLTDTEFHRETEYDYDSNGFRRFFSVKELDNDLLLHRITTELDALGRESTTTDEHMVFNRVLAKVVTKTNYDAVDNVRHQHMTFTPPRYSTQCQVVPQEYDWWNSYDDADRVLTVDGVLDNNRNVTIAKGHGIQFGYINNRRSSEWSILADGRQVNTLLFYTNDGNIWQANNSYVAVEWRYGTDNTIGRDDKGLWNDWRRQNYAGNFVVNEMYCTENQWVSAVRIWDSKLAHHMDDKLWSTTIYTLSDNGLPTHIQNVINVDRNTTTDELDVTYHGEESYQVLSVSGYRHNRDGNTNRSRGDFWFDVNNHVLLKCHSDDEEYSDIGGDDPRKFVYVETTTEGHILSKQFLNTYAQGVVGTFIPLKHEQLLLNASGKMEGAYRAYMRGENFPDYMHHHYDGSQRCALPACTPITPYRYNRRIGMLAEDMGDAKNDMLSGEYVRQAIPMGPQTYFVTAGDTLTSISEQLYGDPEYAHQLEKANGLLINKTLAPGQLLFLPQVIPNRNKSHSARSYHELINLLTGRLMPHMESPLPKAKRTSFLGTLIKIVAVSIVLAVAPYLATHVFMLTGISNALATAALTGLGDAAVQGLAIAADIQQRFLISEVFETAVMSAVVSPGAREYASFMNEPGNLASQTNALNLAKQALYIGTVQAGTQLAGMEIGLWDKFNVGTVATQVLTSLTAPLLQDKLQSVTGEKWFGRAILRAVRTTVAGLISKGVANTPLALQNLAAQAVGSTVTDEMSDRLMNRTAENFSTDSLQKRNDQRTQAANDTAAWNREMQRVEEVTHAQLQDPTLDLNALSRVRAQRWNASGNNARHASNSVFVRRQQPAKNSAADELITRAQQASQGGSYSFMDNATTLETVIIYGAAAGLAVALLPEVALAAISTLSSATIAGPIAEAAMLDTLGGLALRQAVGGASVFAVGRRFGLFSQGGGLGASIGAERTVYRFKPGEDVAHFEKHGTRVANKLDLGSGYNIEQYVQDANHIIHEGVYVPELHGYVKIPTGTGSAQAPFVGLDRATNEITTFHMKPVSFFEKNAPSLGWQAKPASELSDLIGLNRELGSKSPYRTGL